MTKRYDAEYFEKWYRSRDSRVHSHDEVRRKIVLALSSAEYFLQHRVETVLDVGCGEGAWLTHLKPLRPQLKYTGIDSSEYAVERFGRSRNIRLGTFGELGRAAIRRSFDLVVCSDVLHYLDQDEIERGLPYLGRAIGGVAYIEVLTKEDSIVGDLEGLIQRPARWYRRLLGGIGLVQVGPYLWLTPKLREAVSPLETSR
jgi:SAM-dependent methyltransferase